MTTEKGTILYDNRKVWFYKEFILLVEKGGLDRKVFESNMHLYALGYFS